MKQLTLIRHAKSSWDAPGLDDFDRPLNQRGLRDAPEMGQRLRKEGIRPDLVLVSPAVRARETAELLLPSLDLGREKVQFEKEIYEASCATLLKLVRSQPDQVVHLMLIGHNPGFTEIWNLLCPQPVDNIPTCGVFSLAVGDIDSWNLLKEKNGKLVYFDYPKKGGKKK